MLTRTINKGIQSASRAHNVEFSEDNVIMYDPLNRTLFQGSLKALGSESKHTPTPILQICHSKTGLGPIKILIKNCRTKVDIRVPLCSPSALPKETQEDQHGDEYGIYLATVDLRRLGRTVKNGVRSGRIRNVYVLGYVPDRLMSSTSADNSDEE